MEQQILSIFFGLTSYFVSLYLLRLRKKDIQYSALNCVLPPFGHVTFVQVEDNLCRIECHLKGVTPGLHGLHAHEFGDLTNGCNSTCKHYNPDHTSHGGPLGTNRHRGDFGNILVDEYGNCNGTYLTNVNLSEIIGRGLILHEDEDDLGLGGNEESKKTGNAGKRIACGVIGISHQ
tara:strand:+ start:1281 stop:1808 length:528 start_codon:yes stop_codon:yes gene_type:complete